MAQPEGASDSQGEGESEPQRDLAYLEADRIKRPSSRSAQQSVSTRPSPSAQQSPSIRVEQDAPELTKQQLWHRLLRSFSGREAWALDGSRRPSPTVETSLSLSTDYRPRANARESRLATRGLLSQNRAAAWQVAWETERSTTDASFLWSQVEIDEEMGFDTLHVSRTIEDRGFLRAGRYEPDKLKSLGRIDGLQGELFLGNVFSTGVLAGFSGESSDDFDDGESLAVAYFSAKVGETDGWNYLGTFGFLGTANDGDPDRVALLVEQEAALSKYLKLFSSSEVDLNLLSKESESGFRLSGAKVKAEAPVTSFLTLKVGVDHEKTRRSSAASKTDTASAIDPAVEDGTWRRWVGATQRLPWNLELSGELALEEVAAGEDGLDESWEVTLSKLGLFLLPKAKVGTTIYTENEGDLRGYSGTVSGNIQFLNQRLLARPSVTFSVLEPGESSVNLSATEASLRGHWQANTQLSVFAGSTYTFVEAPLQDAPVAEIGLQYFW